MDHNSEKFLTRIKNGGEMRATDKVIQKNQNTAKKNRKSDTQLQNGCQKKKKKQFPSRDIKCQTKNGKTTFPKEFFLEIWLIIEDCKYNYPAEIKFEKKLFACAFLGKQILNIALKMPIYAN